MKTLKIMGIAALALGLLLGVALPVQADSEAEPSELDTAPPKVIVGSVVDIEGQTFTVESRWGEFTISVNNDTKYFKVPAGEEAVINAKNRLEEIRERIREKWELSEGKGRKGAMPRIAGSVEKGLRGLERALEKIETRRFQKLGEKASFTDIEVGLRVIVWEEPQENTLIAKRILIFAQPEFHQVLGTVASISTADRKITITPAAGGSNVVLTYNEQTRFVLRGNPVLAGQSVRAVYDNDLLVKVIFAPRPAD